MELTKLADILEKQGLISFSNAWAQSDADTRQEIETRILTALRALEPVAESASRAAGESAPVGTLTYGPNSNPWGAFLEVRADAIDWLFQCMGETELSIARMLSMDEIQVRLIHTRERRPKIYANPAAAPLPPGDTLLVPREPTEAMAQNGARAYESFLDSYPAPRPHMHAAAMREAYHVMLSAAPATARTEGAPSPRLECHSLSANCRKNNPNAKECCALFSQYMNKDDKC